MGLSGISNFRVGMKVQAVSQYVQETQTASGAAINIDAAYNGTHLYMMEQSTSAQLWASVKVTGTSPANRTLHSYAWDFREQFNRIAKVNGIPQAVCVALNGTFPVLEKYSSVLPYELTQYAASQGQDNFNYAMTVVQLLNSTWEYAGSMGKDAKGKTLSMWRNWQYMGESSNGYVGQLAKLITASPNDVPVTMYLNMFTVPLRIDLTGFQKGKATAALAPIFRARPADSECVFTDSLATGPTANGRHRRRMQEGNPDDISPNSSQAEVEENAYSKGLEMDDKMLDGNSTHLRTNYPHMYHFVSNVPAASLPKSYDLRARGEWFTVRNQMSCGACFAFAAASALESVMYKSTVGNMVTLSPQAAMDCTTAMVEKVGAAASRSDMATSSGCNGGNVAWTIEGLIAGGGLPQEETYPYVGINGACKTSLLFNTSASQLVFKPDGYFWLVGSYDEEDLATPAARNVTKIKQALVQYGAVAVAVHAGDDWHAYTGGVLNSTECAANNPDEYAPDHAVVIIGWTEDGNWIVANQWSEYWGMYGTMLLPFDNDCYAATLFPMVMFKTSQLPPGTRLRHVGDVMDSLLSS